MRLNMEEDIIVKINEAIKEDYYKENYSNDGQRFVAWYLRNIMLIRTADSSRV